MSLEVRLKIRKYTICVGDNNKNSTAGRHIFIFPKYERSNRASRLRTSETEAVVILSMVKVQGESLSSCAVRHKRATVYRACV